jgi:pimeloyl-ACP methyl ester carboxylesterase
MTRISAALLSSAVIATGAAALPSSSVRVAARVSRAPETFNVGMLRIDHYGRAGRTPIIFIPALFCGASQWQRQIAALSDRYDIYALTLPGFDGRPRDAGGNLMGRAAADISTLIRTKHLDHPIIVGHSLGGVMSLWLAETDPAIGGVVDVDGMPFLAAAMDPSAAADKAMQIAASMRQQLLSASHDQFVGFMKQFLGAMVTDPTNAKLLNDAAEKSDQTAVANAMSEMLAKDLRPDLGKITAPVVIVAAGEGQTSRDQLEAEWKAQVDTIPHHELVIVDGAKHFVMLDKPDAFYAQLDKAISAK